MPALAVAYAERSRRRSVGHLGVDVDDPAASHARASPGARPGPSSIGLFTKNSSWSRWSRQVVSARAIVGLRTGGVDAPAPRPGRVSNRSTPPARPTRSSSVTSATNPAAVPPADRMRRHDGVDLVVVDAVHRHRPVRRAASRRGRSPAPRPRRAAGDQRHPSGHGTIPSSQDRRTSAAHRSRPWPARATSRPAPPSKVSA